MRYSPPCGQRGFTLIELLVVIAIIAILAAILFPVFGRARDKAHTAQCTSNQRQIVTAVMMWTQDHDEALPALEGFWQAIQIDPKVFECPSYDARNGYGVNQRVAGRMLGDVPKQTEAVLIADWMPTDADANVLKSGLTTGGVVFSSNVRKKHNKGAVYAFLDGHTEWSNQNVNMAIPGEADVSPGAPTATLSSPSNPFTYFPGQVITVKGTATDDGTVVSVKLFVTGPPPVEAGSCAPAAFPTTGISYTIPANPPAGLGLYLELTDDAGRTSQIAIEGATPGVAQKVAFVSSANDGTGSTQSQALAALLPTGYTAQYFKETSSNLSTVKAPNYCLIVIDRTITSGNAQPWHANGLPVILCRDYAFRSDKCQYITSTDSGDKNTSSQKITIVNATHPLAAGFSGDVTVYNASDTIAWGRAANIPAGGILIAHKTGDPTQAVLWGLPVGVGNGTNNIRRVAFYAQASTGSNVNNGVSRALFQAAVNWAIGNTN